ncbi:hypothetical protein [Streptomyces sp. NPDC046939]|uniref:hypothetical protein n=1 Tax=Streptomyces sp. NPDC046939 TaxID=3155376 RepID=UPI0033FFA96C
MWIDRYWRRDGTEVRAHSRWAAGGRREVAVFVAVAAVVVIGGNSVQPASDAAGSTPGTSRTSRPPGDSGRADPGGPKGRPRPTPTSVYPVRLPGWEEPGKQPRPTVSYPIRYPRSAPR